MVEKFKGQDGFSGKRRWKYVSAAIVLAILGFVGLSSWAVASPVGSSPDDDYHMVSIWCAWGEREGLCEPGANADERRVSNELVHSSKCYLDDNTHVADCEISGTHISTSRGDFANNYPPVYYRVMGIFASENVQASTLAIRLANAAIFVCSVTLLFALLRPGQRGPLFWAVVVGLVPLGMFIIPSINPSSWAVLSGLTVWLTLTGHFTATTKSRQIALGVFALAATVMGAGARGDAGVYAVIAAGAAAILTFNPSKVWLKRLILPLVVILIGATFFLTTGNSTSYASAGVAQGQAVESGTAVSSWPLVIENLMLTPSLWAGSLGTWGLGWFEVGMPQTVSIIMIGAFSAIAFRGIRVLPRRKGLTLALMLLALLVIPGYILYGLQILVGTEVQPRYILPLVLMSIGIAAYGFRDDTLGLTGIQSRIIFAGVSFANSFALYTTMRRYLTGTDYTGLNLNSNIEWWWTTAVPPMAVWFVGSASFGLALFGIFMLLQRAVDREPQVDQELGFVA